MAEDPYRYFRLEAKEILDQFGTAVLGLERTGTNGEVPQLLRLAHTLKGAARIVRQPEIADRAHAIEDALSPYREAKGGVPHDRIAAVLQHLDAIAERVGALGSPAATEPRPPAGDTPIRTLRAEIAEVDALIDGMAETHALLGGLRAALGEAGDAERLADLVVAQLAPRRDADATWHPDRTHVLADDLRRRLGGVGRRLGGAIDRIDRELRQLREAAEQLRLIGADTLFGALERIARDTAQALSKEITFTARGGDIRLDADILAAMQGALVQIVRNAVAHGIESAAERRAAGKPAAGHIALDIARRGGRVVFACGDDGRGLDLEAVRRTAQQRGLAAAAAGRLDAAELVRLLLHGGISTAERVTEIAGRGVGLDVVRAAIERLGGTVAATTEAGNGTRFELAVPLSLAAMEALVVEAAGTIAAIPLAATQGAALRDGGAIARDTAGATVLDGGEAIPFLWLPQVLGGARVPIARNWPMLVVAATGGRVAVGVDRLLGTAQTVMRPLPGLAPAGGIAAGAALDAAGGPRLVLDPDGLLAAARRADMAEAAAVPERRPVLVVDDSLTTRMLEQSILEAAGYEVDVAVSAEEALEVAHRKRYALFLVDVEMPGMDGFGFVERVGADPALRDIPAVLVTSRAAPEDRQRGREVGARGYIVKGEFDQRELLSMIRPLVGQR